MRALLLSLTLGIAALGVTAATPSQAEARWWHRNGYYNSYYGAPYYNGYYAAPYRSYGNYRYPGYYNSYYYTPGYYGPGYSSYYYNPGYSWGYSNYYAAPYTSFYYGP